MTTITAKRPTAAKSTPSKRQLQYIDLLLATWPESKASEYVASASNESEREARLKDVFKGTVDAGISMPPESAIELFLKDPETSKRLIKSWTTSEKELEALWKKNKQKYNLNSKFTKRPSTLRGPDFTKELLRLFAVTDDQRFYDAFMALVDRHMIDAKFNFTRWQLPWIAEREADKNCTMLDQIRDLKKQGKSTRRACMETAANFGLRANSFDAAIKQLKLLYASDGKKGAA